MKWPRTQFPEPEAVWQGPRSFRSRLREHQGRGSGSWGVGAQEKLACPVSPRRSPGETQAQESRTISAPGTQERVGAAQRWPWSRSPLTSVHLRVSRSVFTEHFLGARPWAGSWEHSSKQGRPIAVPKELMFLVGGGHKNRKVKLSKEGASESTTGAHTSKWSFSSSGGGDGELLLPDLGRKQQLKEWERKKKEQINKIHG